MTFDKILEDKRLWAVRYEGEKSNCFDTLFSSWYDMNWLKSFFKENIADLSAFFHITDVYEAVMDTIDEAKRLECLISLRMQILICYLSIWKTVVSPKCR